MSISQTNIAMKHRRNSYLGILNQDKLIITIKISNISNKYINRAQKESLYQNPQSRWSTNMINMSMSQVKAQGLSMCNQKTSTHWSTHQTSHLLHLKFKLDPLNFPQWSRQLVDPVFRLMRFPLDGELDFILKRFYSLRKWLGAATYFFFIFKRVNKIRKKNLSVTPYFENCGLWKIGSSSGVRLLIGNVW